MCLVVVVGCRSRTDSDTEQASLRSTPEAPADEPDAVAADPAADEDRAGQNRDDEIRLSEQAMERGDWDAAARRLKSLLLVDPQDVEVIFRLAAVTAMRGNLPEAVELLDSIPADHAEAGVPSRGQAADWCLQLQRYDDAERRYLEVLERMPDSPEAHRKLAYLFNCQGRRHEAASHIRQLCRQGNVRQDELHALIHLSDAMLDDPSAATPMDGHQPYFPIGPSAIARKLFQENRYDEALKVLQENVSSGQAPPSVLAFYGRIAAEAQDDQQFQWWLARTDASTRAFAEYWAALGTSLVLQNRTEEAVRALLEAVDRDPTDFRSINRLWTAMLALGRNEEANRWEQRWKKLRDILAENNRIADASTPNAEAMARLADLLDTVDRSLEAVLWRAVAAIHQNLPRESMLALNAKRLELIQQDRGFPDQASRLCDIQLAAFPVPDLQRAPETEWRNLPLVDPQSAPPQPARLENVAEAIGLHHVYQVASEPLEFGFRVYQSIGGAVAVADYDLDGNPDLYFAQGASDPPEFVADQSNVLYRNLNGDRLIETTKEANALEYRYTMGATTGDWNQDGFADIVVANLGANTLFLNNGDGTFSRSILDDRDDTTFLTTSLAMADLTGDHLPDLFEMNYLHDEKITDRPRKNERGEVVQSLTPADFAPAIDRLIFNDGKGGISFQDISDQPQAACAGLGIVVGEMDGIPGNEVFVGNDIYANQLWFRRPDADGSGQPDRWVDEAMLRGCAFAFNGAKTASMGVAAGDFDGNGWLDFHVTNFQNEAVSLFLNQDGFFQDRNVQFALARPSLPVLGFGTQVIDYDNNGNLDVVVANGHIENAVTLQGQFRQPAQLFCNVGGRFEPVDVQDDSGYWGAKHLGRALARLDFNGDGRMDYAVTHLGETSALLLNRTATNNRWLQLQLVGVESERDAIGARVEIGIGNRKWTQWVLSGDGFLCRNQSILSFGVGSADRIDQLTIVWPTGKTQSFRDIDVDRRLLMIENESSPFSWQAAP